MISDDPKVQSALITAERILRESIKMQEEAADRILDLAEQIAETTQSRSVLFKSEAIMQACAFQDLSCQRLNKVAKLMKFLQSPNAATKVAKAQEPEQQQAFEKPGAGMSQEQVDRLLAGDNVKDVI